MLVHMNEVEQKHRGHWFSKDTMRFFKSRIGVDAYLIDGAYYFVSSEQGPNGIRRYTVRKMVGGAISSYSEFQEYSTGRQALAVIKQLLKGN